MQQIRFIFLMMAVCSVSFAGGEVDQESGELMGKLQSPVIISEDALGYLARIELNNPAEVEAALQRAEDIYLSDGIPEGIPPVVFVLHGPEVSVFQKSNYQRYKPIVDLAARLAAFEVVDIRICRTQMRVLSQSEDGLYPFVGSVPYGPAEAKRLLEDEQYVYF